jgi:uncharacterized membrane protein
LHYLAIFVPFLFVMDAISVFFLAMTPVGELRVSIPFGIGLHRMHWLIVFVISVIGNMIPPLIILYGFDRLPFLRKWKLFTSKPLKKASWISRFGYMGLLLLVAIPLPGTGAWTGSLLAWILKLSKGMALTMIFLGVSVAGIIVTLASMGIIHLISFPER